MQLRLFENRYSKEKLITLLEAPLHYKQTVESLLDFYHYVTKELWSKSFIKQVATEHELNLRKTSDRIKFSRIAIEIELSISQPQLEAAPEAALLEAELEETRKELLEARETIKKQNKVIALLKAGKPLNGRENSPIFRVFGCPSTRDQLISNYRKLRVLEHPDCSNYDGEIACDRFSFLKASYTALLDNWASKYDPTLEIAPDTLQKALAAKLPFNPDSFWFAHFS